MYKTCYALAALVTFLAAAPAQAHVTGFPHEAGAGHPVLGIDHLLVLLAVGVAVGIALYRRR